MFVLDVDEWFVWYTYSLQRLGTNSCCKEILAAILEHILINSKDLVLTELNYFTDLFVATVYRIWNWIIGTSITVRMTWIVLGANLFFDKLNLAFQNPINKIRFVFLPVDGLIKLVEIVYKEIWHEFFYIVRWNPFKKRCVW